MTAPKIDFVTVVFRQELPLLRLQAASLDRYFERDAVGKIHVLINDINDDLVVADLEGMLDCYGSLRDRVQVLRPEDVFDLRWFPVTRVLASPGLALDLVQGARRRLQRRRYDRGWRSYTGWQIQQALKIAVARRLESEQVVILDAKNHFLAPITTNDFFAPDGKPRCRTRRLSEMELDWIRASFAKLDLSVPDFTEEQQPGGTPCAVTRSILTAALEDFEGRYGPIQNAFIALRAGKKRRDGAQFTEFGLIYATAHRLHGNLASAFEGGLIEYDLDLRIGGSRDVETALAQIERGDCRIVGLHRSLIPALPADLRARFVQVWRHHGLCDHDPWAA